MMGKRAVIYARTSSDDRGSDIPSNEDQLRAGRELAARYNYHVIEEIREDDAGASGYDPDLPGMIRVMELVKLDAFDVLIALRFDRLSRLMWRALEISWKCLERGKVVIHLAADDKILNNYEENELKILFDSYMNQREGKELTKKLNRKIRTLVSELGQTMVHGRPPFGYKLVRDKKEKIRELQINEEEARIVRMIFDLYTGKDPRGPMGLSGIAKLLSKMTISTYADKYSHKKPLGGKVRDKGQWSKSSVYHILKNETYAGTWYYGKRGRKKIGGQARNYTNGRDQWLMVEVPPIISKEQFQAAQARREKNKRRKVSKNFYLLSGQLTCAHCGGAMTGAPVTVRGKTYLYYRCMGALGTKARECDNGKSFNSQQLDTAVLDWLAEVLSNPDQLDMLLDKYLKQREQLTAPIRRRQEEIERMHGKHKRDLEKLLDLYLDGRIDVDLIARKEHELKTLLAGLEEERRRLENKITDILSEEQVANLRQAVKKLAKQDGNGSKLKERILNANEKTKRMLIDSLRVTGDLSSRKEEKKAQMKCIISEAVLYLPFSTSRNAKQYPQHDNTHLVITALFNLSPGAIRIEEQAPAL